MGARHIACVGDLTTTGGVVLPHGANTTLLFGRRTAIIGGMATCLACKGVGTIAKSGGSRRLIGDGKEVALHDDIVQCACPSPPKVIAGQHDSSYTDQA